MKQVQLSDRQSSFIFYLVHQGKGRTEAARLAGFAAPRQSAFNLAQSPKIIAKIRQERNNGYRTYKNRVLSTSLRLATPPPCHTQKGANILFMVSDTNLLQNELFDFYASRRSSSTAWQATQISSPTFRSFGIS